MEPILFSKRLQLPLGNAGQVTDMENTAGQSNGKALQHPLDLQRHLQEI
jgi:hypothetical protein